MSITNEIIGGFVGDIKVGAGATLLGYSDRYPATIIEISGDKIIIQEDNYKRVGKIEMSESQDYEYSPNEHGIKHSVIYKKNKKRYETTTGTLVRLGVRERYYDYTK